MRSAWGLAAPASQEWTELFPPNKENSGFWAKTLRNRFFCLACFDARTENLKPYLWTNFRLCSTNLFPDFRFAWSFETRFQKKILVFRWDLECAAHEGCLPQHLCVLAVHLVYRGTSPIRKRSTPWDPPRTLGRGLRWRPGDAFSCNWGTPVGCKMQGFGCGVLDVGLRVWGWGCGGFDKSCVEISWEERFNTIEKLAMK